MLPIYPLSWRAPESRKGEESLAKPLIARLGATRGGGPPPRDDKNEFSSCASKARVRAARQREPLGVPERLTLRRATGRPATLRVGPIAPSGLGGFASGGLLTCDLPIAPQQNHGQRVGANLP